MLLSNFSNALQHSLDIGATENDKLLLFSLKGGTEMRRLKFLLCLFDEFLCEWQTSIDLMVRQKREKEDRIFWKIFEKRKKDN